MASAFPFADRRGKTAWTWLAFVLICIGSTIVLAGLSGLHKPALSLGIGILAWGMLHPLWRGRDGGAARGGLVS